jgi:hypothetical protein
MKYFSALLSTFALVACGGGGGSTATPVTPTAVLNSSNQNYAAQDTASASFMPLMGAQTLTGAQTKDESVLFAFARNQMTKLPAYLTAVKAASTLTGAVQSQTVFCTLGGTLTLSGSDADNNNVVSVGDSVTISGNNCVEPEGTLNGDLSFAINSVSGNFGSNSYGAGMTMTFSNFTVSSAQFAASANGSLTLSINVTGVNIFSAGVSTPSLTVSGTYSGVTRTRTLADYSATMTQAPDVTYGYVTSTTVSGSLTSSALSSQRIAFATPTPFVTRSTDSYPSTGVLVISGASNTKLKLTALSNTQVLQELDANGDGTYESNTTVNWNTLM